MTDDAEVVTVVTAVVAVHVVVVVIVTAAMMVAARFAEADEDNKFDVVVVRIVALAPLVVSFTFLGVVATDADAAVAWLLAAVCVAGVATAPGSVWARWWSALRGRP